MPDSDTLRDAESGSINGTGCRLDIACGSTANPEGLPAPGSLTAEELIRASIGLAVACVIEPLRRERYQDEPLQLVLDRILNVVEYELPELKQAS